MNKHDRAKMEKRIVRKLEIMLKRDVFGITSVRLDELVRVIAREVDRAVRAERRKWQADEDKRLERLRKIDAELVDGLKRIGAPKL